MTRRFTRRRALATASAAVLTPFVARGQAQSVAPGSRYFAHGVASGDSDHDSLVLWTRISDHVGPARVDWEMTEDAAFTRPVASGSAATSADRDYTVKVLVGGLRPGQRYYYRFCHRGETSPTGRTRTLPALDPPSVTFAVASCSNYPFGYFNAYGAIAEDEQVEWVLHLGDYLYEYGPDGYGGQVGALLGRDHEPRQETVTLRDYRRRHAQYKADPQSQRMHAAHPLLAIWDDHEFTNNPWTGGAQNHQPDSEGAWQARRDAALQAYLEWMPVRDPFPGQQRADYWRHWRFGSLASLVSLETRLSGRAEQIEYAAHEDMLDEPDGAARFLREVLGAPDRPMISAGMAAFLESALRESRAAGRPWRVLANQIPMARTLNPVFSAAQVKRLGATLEPAGRERLDLIARRGEFGLPLYLDPWDGYPVAREAFYALCRDCDVRDLLVLTGDSHRFWSNQLFDDGGTPMGLELGTNGITSPADFTEFGPAGSAAMDEALAATNPEILWTAGGYNGYVRLALFADHARADYLAVDQIARPEYTVSTVRSVSIVSRDGSLVYR